MPDFLLKQMPVLSRKAKRFSFTGLYPRILLAGALVLIIVLLLTLSLYRAQEKRLPARPVAHKDAPNIILIVTDDQRADTLQYMPNVKNLLSSRGVTFANAYSTTPLCCPARASLLTGLYAHNHKIWTNQNGYGLFDDTNTLPIWLQKAGYRTGLVGKYLNGYQTTDIPPGWDTWYGRVRNTYYGYDLNENGTIVSYGFDPKDYSTDVYANLAVKFITGTAGKVSAQPKQTDERQEKKQKKKQQRQEKKQSLFGFFSTPFVHAQEQEEDRPYFLMVAVDAPHTDGGRSSAKQNAQAKKSATVEIDAPGNRLRSQRDQTVQEDDDDGVTTDGQDGLKTHVVKDYYAMPSELDRKSCEPITIATSPAFAEADISDKSEWVKQIPAWNQQDRQRMRRFATSQVCSLRAVDRLVKKIVEAVENDSDNTVILFVSDNGYSWGEHRLSTKNCIYDACSHVPLVISDPRVIKRAEVAPTFVELVDIPVTIAALAYATHPKQVNGRSLVPALSDPNLTIRENILLEVNNNKNRPKGHDFAIRTKTHKYVELSTGERELYDLRRDPSELTNLMAEKFAPSTYRSIINDLSALLKARKAE